MKRYVYSRIALCIGLFLFVLNGCASTTPAKFYTLSAMSRPEAPQDHVPSRPDAVGIRVNAIPDYLDRPQVVTRSSENRLVISDFDKWAGSLQDDISRVLAENLSSLLSTGHVYVYPWKQSIPVKYLVEVDVIRFDGMRGGDVSLKAQWTISEKDGMRLLSWSRSDFSEQADGQSYESLIAAESRLLARLSRDIAAAVRSVSE